MTATTTTTPNDGRFLLVLNGGYGVGKSATLEHVGDALAAAGRPFALFDVDWFHRCWPPAGDDPDNVVTEAANLAAVWANYRALGWRQPVLAGVLANTADRDRYQRAFALPVRSIRLTAGETVTGERLRRRYTADQRDALDWHLERHAAIAARLAAADLDELVLDTERLTPAGSAVRILNHWGLGSLS